MNEICICGDYHKTREPLVHIAMRTVAGQEDPDEDEARWVQERENIKSLQICA